MPLQIVRNDITLMKVDAIVNSTNRSLIGGGGADGAIHKAAGPALQAECLTLGGCKPGEAKVTHAYNLPCRYVIHTVAPVWRGGFFGENEHLRSCYRNSLECARDLGLVSVAFPLIASGVFGYPRKKALKTAVDTISEFLTEAEMVVYIVVYDKESFRISDALFGGVSRYIDDRYVEECDKQTFASVEASFDDFAIDAAPYDDDFSTDFSESFDATLPYCSPLETEKKPVHAKPRPPKTASTPKPCFSKSPAESKKTAYATKPSVKPHFARKELDYSESTRQLQEAFRMIDESFSQMVLRLIDQKGMKDPECYKRANMDRKLFSKIRNDIHYKPKKTTAVALAIALRLTRPEADELLMKAGLALSHSSKFDIIIEYCFNKKIYDIHQVNSILFEFDQPLLGA